MATSCDLKAPRCTTVAPPVRLHGPRGGVFVGHRPPRDPGDPRLIHVYIYIYTMKKWNEVLRLFRRSTHTHTYTLTHLHIYTLTHLHTYTFTHLHTYTLTHLHTYTLTHLHTYTLTHLHTYTLTHLHTYTLTHLHTYTLTHTHTHHSDSSTLRQQLQQRSAAAPACPLQTARSIVAASNTLHQHLAAALQRQGASMPTPNCRHYSDSSTHSANSMWAPKRTRSFDSSTSPTGWYWFCTGSCMQIDVLKDNLIFPNHTPESYPNSNLTSGPPYFETYPYWLIGFHIWYQYWNTIDLKWYCPTEESKLQKDRPSCFQLTDDIHFIVPGVPPFWNSLSILGSYMSGRIVLFGISPVAFQAPFPALLSSFVYNIPCRNANEVHHSMNSLWLARESWMLRHTRASQRLYFMSQSFVLVPISGYEHIASETWSIGAIASLVGDIRPCAGTMENHSTRKKKRMAMMAVICLLSSTFGTIETATSLVAGDSLHTKGVARYGPTTPLIYILMTWECQHLDGRIPAKGMSTSSCTSQGAQTPMGIDGSLRLMGWHLVMRKKKRIGSQWAKQWVMRSKCVGSRVGRATMGRMIFLSIWMAPCMVRMSIACGNGRNAIRQQAVPEKFEGLKMTKRNANFF